MSKITTAQAEIERIVKGMSSRTSAFSRTQGLTEWAQFFERLTRVVQYVNYNPTFRFAIMSVNLDGFEPFKTRAQAGDLVLRHVAQSLSESFKAA